MKRARVFMLILAIVIVSVIAMPDRHRSARQDFTPEDATVADPFSADRKDPGFPFEIVSEEFTCCLAPPTWQVRIRIPKDSYSRENLDRLFRFYAQVRHPNLKERLYVYVYAHDLRSDDASVPELPLDNPFDVTVGKPNGIRWDANFVREGYGFYFGREEHYSYRPDPESDEEKIVILKGTLINRPKTIVESWKTSNGTFRMRVLAYYLEGVDPAGVYYTFQSFNSDPEWFDWKEVMTSRQDKSIPIPASSVVFLADNIAYVTMGSMYAVTTDSGVSWSRWDAERDFTQGHWSDHWTILQVEVAAGGNGTMGLSPSSESSAGTTLHTSDFGRHWYSDQ